MAISARLCSRARLLAKQVTITRPRQGRITSDRPSSTAPSERLAPTTEALVESPITTSTPSLLMLRRRPSAVRPPTTGWGSSFQSPLWYSRLPASRSEEHTSELQSRENLVCRLLLEKKDETAAAKIVN